MTRTCKYTVGQAVEVHRHDFAQRGHPITWQQGVVDRLEPIGSDAKGLVQVFVEMPDGSWSPQIVGPRGGNKRIRPAS